MMGRKTKMNSITSPELLAQVNPDNVRLKKDFLDYLKSTQKSEGTRHGYDSDLNIFFVWVLQNAGNKPFVKITKRDIASYQNWLINENENSPARVRRLKAAISSLSNFVTDILDDEEEYQNFKSVVKKIENPVLQPVREKTVLEEDQVNYLLQTLVDKKKYKQACCLALAAYSGRRKAELPRFRVSDFSDDNLVIDGAMYKSAPIKTKGRGMGKYIRCYTLAKKFKPYFDLWMDYRKENGIESEWLLPSEDDPSVPVGIPTLNSWANSFSRILGVDFYFHAMRHNFTTSLAKAGIPDGVITSIIGWESQDMCKIYKDIEADEEIAMYFKNGDISVPDKKGLADI